MTTLVPNYLDVDFATIKQRLKDLLIADATFQDYDFEGANVSILMELVAYHGALTTYFLNRIAKNCFLDTADVYECVHMQGRLRGYNAMGYRSSSTNLTISVKEAAGISDGDTLYIPAWTQFKCSSAVDTDGNPLYFANTEDLTETVDMTTGVHEITLPVRQGIVTTYNYTGRDITDNKFYLPFYNFDYGDDLEGDTPYMQLQVGEEIWTRVSNFYDEISGLTGVSDSVYMFRYDKYQKYLIEFSSARSVPTVDDAITVTVLRTAGKDGNVGAASINTVVSAFITNRTENTTLANTSNVTITNVTASTGGASPETIEEIKNSSEGTMHSQYRNVTASDYRGHLESRADIVVSNVWGEQEIAPSGSIEDFNKVFISLIPEEWGTGTISVSASPNYNGYVDEETAEGIFAPVEYSSDWKTTISTYLETRKMLCVYEEYVLPEIVFFTFDIGLRVKRNYVFDTVKGDVWNKLKYYFSPENRAFNETIDFIDIQSYIVDATETSPDDDFNQVKGISAIVMRGQRVLGYPVYEPNSVGDYPQYYETSSEWAADDNKLRAIVLGFNQFPMLYEYLAPGGCTIVEEA